MRKYTIAKLCGLIIGALGLASAGADFTQLVGAAGLIATVCTWLKR